MTIKPGSEWGHRGTLPVDSPVVTSDAEAAVLVAEWAAAGRQPGGVTVGLAGGDLHRTIGAPPLERMTTSDAMVLPCDVGLATIEGAEHWFVAHLVAGDGPWFKGPTSMVMNAAFIGTADLGPRAHPGDGLLDVTSGRLSWRDRRAARSRYGAGTHVPHPGLSTSRVSTVELRFDRPVDVRLDGVWVGRSSRIDVVVVPDVLTVIA
jgi:hypothetical protein